MSFSIHKLPTELVDRIENRSRFLSEPTFEFGRQAAVLDCYHDTLTAEMLRYVLEHALLPEPIIATSRPAQLLQYEHDSQLVWHVDFAHRVPKHLASEVKMLILVAGEPRPEFRVDGGIHILDRGELAFYDATVEHRGRPARRDTARWLVRFMHFPEEHTLPNFGDFLFRERAVRAVHPSFNFDHVD